MQIAAAAASCVVLGSLFWRAAAGPPAQITYWQCGAIHDDVQRLQCFDTVLRQHSAADAHRMTFAEILMGPWQSEESPGSPR